MAMLEAPQNASVRASHRRMRSVRAACVIVLLQVNLGAMTDDFQLA